MFLAAVGPLVHVVHLAVIRRPIALRVGAATVLGRQHDSLVLGGCSFRPLQVQCAPIVVEDGQVVMGVTGHPDESVRKHVRRIGPTKLPWNMLGYKLIDDRTDRGGNSLDERLYAAKDGETVALRQRLRIEFRERVDGMSQSREDLTCVDINHRTHVRMMGRHSDKWTPNVADDFVVTQVISGSRRRWPESEFRISPDLR